MKAADITLVRSQVSQIIRELGMVVHHCEEAASAQRQRWATQVASDTNEAVESSSWVTEHSHRLELLLRDLAHKKQPAKKGGAS